MTVKIHLSGLLQKNKMTQEELAAKTGIDFTIIQSIFNESIQEIDLNDLEKICHVLDCQISDLIESN